MRCIICNKPLNESESVAKDEETGEYLDTCNRCKCRSREEYNYMYDHDTEHSDVTEVDKDQSVIGGRYWCEWWD